MAPPGARMCQRETINDAPNLNQNDLKSINMIHVDVKSPLGASILTPSGQPDDP